jgi:hypothetical protein
MFNFLLTAAWQIAIFWAALQIFFSMQVIETATVFIDKPALCTFLQQPVTDGHCRFTGRFEGTLRSTWTASPDPDLPIKFELMEKVPGMIYDPKDWHMAGGTAAVVALGAVTLGLSTAGIWISFLVTRRRLKKDKAHI